MPNIHKSILSPGKIHHVSANLSELYLYSLYLTYEDSKLDYV